MSRFLPMIGKPNLFQYKSTLAFTDGRSEVTVLKAPQSWITKYFSIKELEQEFGGYALFSAPVSILWRRSGNWIGIWGARNVSRMRRLLKEQGAVFDIHQGSGPRQQIQRISKVYKFNDKTRS